MNFRIFAFQLFRSLSRCQWSGVFFSGVRVSRWLLFCMSLEGALARAVQEEIIKKEKGPGGGKDGKGKHLFGFE